MKTRPFQIEDLELLLQIERKVFPTPWSQEAFLSFARLPEFWMEVVEEEKQVVGYCVAQVVGEEAELHNIAVDPQWQRKGIGRLLMNHFLEKVKKAGVQSVYLLVRISNQPAIKFYESFQFSLLDRRAKYYEDTHEDALIYHRKCQAGINT